MKMNIAGVEYEGSPQELKELFDLLSDTEFEESKEEYRKVVGRDPRVGDYVKYTESDSINDISADKYYEITGIDEYGDCEFIDDAGDNNVAISGTDDFEIYEKVAPDPEFEVGDYVVALSAADEEYFYTNTDMKLGKVIEICVDGDIKIEVVRHENDSYEGQTFEVDRRFFRKAYKEEVDNAIFTKLGRKPNEFKKGDIVHDGSGDAVFTVLSDFEIQNGYVNFHDGISRKLDEIELVAPVESRVDL